MRVLKAVRVDILIFVSSLIVRMTLDIGCGEGSFELLMKWGVKRVEVGYSLSEW